MTDGDERSRRDEDALDELMAAAAATGSTDPAVEEALRTASTWVGDDVHLVGAGETDDGIPCVVVHASATAEIPEDIDGVPVRVVVDDIVVARDGRDDTTD